MKKIKIRDCSHCPYFKKSGVYGRVMYKPHCSQMDGKDLPFIEIQIRNTKRYRAQPTWKIPSWCPLEDF